MGCLITILLTFQQNTLWTTPVITRPSTYRVLVLLVMLLWTCEAGKAAGTGVGRYGGDTATNTLLTSAPQDPKFSCLLCACVKSERDDNSVILSQLVRYLLYGLAALYVIVVICESQYLPCQTCDTSTPACESPLNRHSNQYANVAYLLLITMMKQKWQCT